MFGSLVTGVTGLLFPLFASYRALVSNDISLIRPWLMYWVVFATFQFVEDMFRPIISIVPFYGIFKAGFLVWMVLPQTQGAVQLYQSKLEPWLRSHNQQIENCVASVAAVVNATPLGALLSFLGLNLPKPPGNDGSGHQQGPGGPQSGGGILDSVMSSFRLNTSPDANLSAYLPAILGGNAPSGEAGSEYYAAVRNRLMGVMKSLDTTGQQGAGARSAGTTSTSSSSANQAHNRMSDSEVYDFVEVPHGSPSPVPGDTEIEREIEHPRRSWL